MRIRHCLGVTGVSEFRSHPRPDHLTTLEHRLKPRLSGWSMFFLILSRNLWSPRTIVIVVQLVIPLWWSWSSRSLSTCRCFSTPAFGSIARIMDWSNTMASNCLLYCRVASSLACSIRRWWSCRCWFPGWSVFSFGSFSCVPYALLKPSWRPKPWTPRSRTIASRTRTFASLWWLSVFSLSTWCVAVRISSKWSISYSLRCSLGNSRSRLLRSEWKSSASRTSC